MISREGWDLGDRLIGARLPFSEVGTFIFPVVYKERGAMNVNGNVTRVLHLLSYEEIVLEGFREN